MSELEKWVTLVEASKIAGKNYRYFTNLKNRDSHYFDDIEIKKIGTSYLIKEEDISKVLSRIKKRGDHLKNRLLKWSKKANLLFAF